MSISTGVDSDTNLKLDLTFGVGKFRTSVKASANIIGGVLRAEWLRPMRDYSQGGDYLNQKMCKANPDLC